MKIQNLLIIFIEFHSTLKLIHFQTSSYGVHKATDKLYKSFGKKYDKFLEVYQGKQGRIPHLNQNLKIKSISDKNIASYCRSIIKTLESATSQTCKVKSNSDLCNILDEMIADINQFIYLISFK